MLQLKIIVNCGPCEAYIGKCLASIKRQTYAHWRAYVTVDPSGDRTFERALESRGGDARIAVRRNPEPLYATANLVRAIERSEAQPEDVIVALDGDDWLYDERALQRIVDAYAAHDCWLTYGSWIPNVDDGYVGKWPAYPEDVTDFRGWGHLATAVRTWKKWLWDWIDDRDLRDAQGAYFRAAGDQAVMFPMLEMSGAQHARHIPDILMVYNRETAHSDDKIRYDESKRNEAYIRSQPAYAPLRDKVLKER